jgi:hypothetical protein
LRQIDAVKRLEKHGSWRISKQTAALDIQIAKKIKLQCIIHPNTGTTQAKLLHCLCIYACYSLVRKSMYRSVVREKGGLYQWHKQSTSYNVDREIAAQVIKNQKKGSNERMYL